MSFPVANVGRERKPMNIAEYLSKKYGVAIATTITKVEAKVFGIPYPLKSGWRGRYCYREIDAHMQQKLIEVLSKKKKGTSAAGLAVFSDAPSAPKEIGRAHV